MKLFVKVAVTSAYMKINFQSLCFSHVSSLFSAQQSHCVQVQLGQSYGVSLILHSEGRQLQRGHLTSIDIFRKYVLNIFTF